MSSQDSVIDLSLLGAVDDRRISPATVEQEVMLLFDRCGPSLLRYVSSFGLRTEEAEDVVQDVFLSLFRHLRLGRSRSHLRGWLFRVAHNLALKQRTSLQKRQANRSWDEIAVSQQADPSPDPESRLADHQRRRRLTSVLHALPERDRRCIVLRAEGLRYREIADALGVSLGSVAKSLTRSITRLVNASER
ncbi:MAG: sigma-70 family RNA polymerase sigma factor [Acidobacteriota bacterium]